MVEHPSSEPHTVTLRNTEGSERSVELSETGKILGKGTRATIREVLVNAKPMARKEFDDANGAERAMRGRQILQDFLPTSEVPLLIPMELEEQHNAVVMPKLNDHAWVISMGKNSSADRAALSQKKLASIPNFHAIVARLMDAVQAFGDKCLAIGPDVYFLTIDHETHELGYTYADTESMHDLPPDVGEADVPLRNIYWAAGALYLFLRECVENPDAYLVRLRQEAIHRMHDYGVSNSFWEKELLEGKDFQWPASNWKQKLAWVGTLVKRHVMLSLKS